MKFKKRITRFKLLKAHSRFYKYCYLYVLTLLSLYSLIFLANVKNASSILILFLHDTSKNGMSKSSAIWKKYYNYNFNNILRYESFFLNNTLLPYFVNKNVCCENAFGELKFRGQ